MAWFPFAHKNNWAISLKSHPFVTCIWPVSYKCLYCIGVSDSLNFRACPYYVNLRRSYLCVHWLLLAFSLLGLGYASKFCLESLIDRLYTYWCCKAKVLPPCQLVILENDKHRLDVGVTLTILAAEMILLVRLYLTSLSCLRCLSYTMDRSQYTPRCNTTYHIRNNNIQYGITLQQYMLWLPMGR